MNDCFGKEKGDLESMYLERRAGRTRGEDEKLIATKKMISNKVEKFSDLLGLVKTK